MSYRVLITRAAEKQLKKLLADVQRKLSAVILSLEIEPRPFGCKKLSGSSASYRLRVADYRIIYDINDREVVVTLLKMGHRRDLYR